MYQKMQQEVSSVGVTVFVLCVTAGGIGTRLSGHPARIAAATVLGLYLMFAIKVVQQWEKVVLLRFGRYVGLRGPGCSPSYRS